MNGELEHMAILAAYGNEYLANPRKGIALEKQQYIRSVKFVKHERNKLKALWQKVLHKDLVATSEQNWFEYLERTDCKALRLIINQKIKDINLIAFANGISDWHIHAIFNDHSELWFRSWHPGNGVWDIVYHGLVAPHYEDNEEPVELSVLVEQFDGVLAEISDFAEVIGCAEWKKWFDKGRSVLAGSSDIDISPLPGAYSPLARQLFAAVKEAWVFGGMGWWNDSPPYMARDHGKEEEYEKLTSQLYETIMRCIQASTNSVTWR